MQTVFFNAQTLGMTYWTRNYKPNEAKQANDDLNDHQYSVEETEDPACIHAFVDVEPGKWTFVTDC